MAAAEGVTAAEACHGRLQVRSALGEGGALSPVLPIRAGKPWCAAW
jgi:hypothetical protein